MERVWKKLLLGLKALGIRFHATGGNYWLGFVAIILCVVLKAPKTVMLTARIAFGIWLLLCVCGLIPDRWLERSKRSGKNELDEAKERIGQLETELSEKQKELEERQKDIEFCKQKIQFLEGMSLKQICLRITERLRSLRFDNASWDFICLNPLEDLLDHKTVRLKLYDAEEYCAAEATYADSGELKFVLMQNVAKEEEADAEKTAVKAVRNIPDPETSEKLRDWMKKHLQDVTDLGYDAYAKGRSDFTIKSDLPDKSLWPLLCGLLEQKGYRFASVSGDGILLGIGPKTRAA